MKIIISPAKSINEEATFPVFEFSIPVFKKEASQINRSIKKLKVKDLMELMHISKDIAELNFQRNKQWNLSDLPSEKVRPAVFLFTGEVYRGLEINSFTPTELQYAQENLRILSGMYGLMKPMDLIYPYRLEMGTKWSPKEDFSNLYQFWGEKLVKNISKESNKNEIIVNLASNEYSKALLTKKNKLNVIEPIFKDFKNGEYKVLAVYAKHMRGTMAREILKNQWKTKEDLLQFAEDGYSYNDSLSTETEIVFTR